MIDFRYHIVSIVSIFLALAVGIVLGAGPLQGEIGSTLQSEVAGLREDKARLNDELGRARSDLEQRDNYLAAVTDRVVAGSLEGRTVALVVLPGADAALGESVAGAVGAAGGRVASTTSVSADWVSTDDKTAAARDAAVEEVLAQAGVAGSSGTGTGTGEVRDVLLATLLARTAVAGDSGPDDETARSGLEALAGAGLVSLEATEFTRAELVVVVSGAVTDGDTELRIETARRWVGLARALDERARGAVLAADVATEAEGASVLAALRKDDAVAEEVSSVDDAAEPMGVASVVFALAATDAGSAGHYGLAPGADAAYPPVPGS